MAKILVLLAIIGIIYFAVRLGGAVNKARRNFEDHVNDYMGSSNRTEYVHRNTHGGRTGGSRGDFSEKDITDQVRVLDENEAPNARNDRN